jgi:hypothetical protein
MSLGCRIPLSVKRALLVILVAALAGCGKADVPTGGPVTVTVSQDFGAERLAPAQRETAEKSETVLGLLQRTPFEVKATGSSVEEILGVSGGSEDGKPVSWFLYVNGIATGQGAAERKLYSGDRVWWDHHDRVRVPAVVGAFPEPFKSGIDGKKLPIRLVCMGSEDRSCDEVETRMKTAGIGGIARSNLESSPGQVVRILVGRWSEMRKDIAARTLEAGPSVSGVFAKPNSTGSEIQLLDPDGDVGKTLGPGSGLVAATRYRDERPTWIVTGTDDVGVAAAAAALTEDRLGNRFALAIEAGRGISLPLPAP